MSSLPTGLPDIGLRRVYESKPNASLIKDFYIPALSASTTYDRLTFSFTSGALRAAALGVAGFIENSGRMRLIAAPQLERADKEALMRASNPKEKASQFDEIVFRKVRNVRDLATEIERRYVDALAWMLRTGALELKLAVPAFHDANEAEGGIFHTKLGILTDIRGNAISFSGSINETGGGWNKNVERFKVYRSWVDSDSEDFDFDRQTFDGYWNEPHTNGIQFVPLSDAAITEFTNKGKASFSLPEIRKIEEVEVATEQLTTQPRDYQVEAIRSWIANGRRGILSMATGSGKTLTATLAVEGTLQEEPNLAVFVLVPNSSIGEQWAREFSQLGIPVRNLSEQSNWKKQFESDCLDMRAGVVEAVAFISVMNRASSDWFTAQVASLEGAGIQTFLVADEAHRFGAKSIRGALSAAYKYRLGLSATPKRYFDDEGTELLLDYFSGSVFEFTIQDALDWTPPRGQNPILTPFQYKPVFVELEGNELDKYLSLTAEIVRKKSAAGKKPSEEDSNQIFNLQLARARVKKLASNKIPALRGQLQERSSFSHAIIYCESETQMEQVFTVLKQLQITAAPFTQAQGSKPESRFGGRSEREETLRLFRSGKVQALVAMNLLDEGVDIPEARLALILASSGNAKEFIQRTGRVIRWHEEKELAEIVDFLVIPESAEKTQQQGGLSRSEMNMVESEMRRIEEYSAPAFNRLEISMMLSNIRQLIGKRFEPKANEDESLG
jgi:superfamily II DNA or RNA helicase